MKHALTVCVVACFAGCAGVSTPAGGSPGEGAPGTPSGGRGPGAGHPGTASHGPYPFVLAHGFSGFHNIGPLTYFYGVADALAKNGHTVFTTQVDPYNDSEVRGAELQAQVEQILSNTGAVRVNLICHSQGALDCRLVAHNLGKKIASVTTVGGANHGARIADIASGAFRGPKGDALNGILKFFADYVLDENGNPNSDARAALAQLTSAGVAAFASKYPDDPDVDYYSIAGRSNDSAGDFDCGSATEAPWISRWDRTTAPANPIVMNLTGRILNQTASPTPTNDGLILVSEARYGTFLGCVPADHLAEICQIGGQSSGSDFDCVTMYRDLTSWLVAHGY